MLGAWAGDQLAFQLGRSAGTDRLRILRTARGRRAVAWARSALDRRGATFILAARYVPVGRVAVNMSAGALGYARRRFLGVSAVAAVMWATCSTVVGVLTAAWLGGQPLLAMAVGVVVGLVLGLLLDRVLARVWARRDAPAERAATVSGRA
jgi:membrane protein DedA with SNARE-associated domain